MLFVKSLSHLTTNILLGFQNQAPRLIGIDAVNPFPRNRPAAISSQPNLMGQGDLASRFTLRITGLIAWLTGTLSINI